MAPAGGRGWHWRRETRSWRSRQHAGDDAVEDEVGGGGEGGAQRADGQLALGALRGGRRVSGGALVGGAGGVGDARARAEGAQRRGVRRDNRDGRAGVEIGGGLDG